MNKISIIEEDYERLKRLSKEDSGLILQNLLHTAYGEDVEITGNEYLDFLSEVVCQKAERFAEISEKRSKVGALGKGVSKNKANESKTKAKTKQTESKSEAHTIPNHTIPNHTIPNHTIPNYVEEIVSYLNEKAGKHFQAKGESVKYINGRLNEGYTVEDFKKVIDKKVKKWKDDPKMFEFLRPSTLFAPSHFDEYLNEPDTAPKVVKTTNQFNNFQQRPDDDIDYERFYKLK